MGSIEIIFVQGDWPDNRHLDKQNILVFLVMFYNLQRIFSFLIYVMLKTIYRVGIIITVFLQMRKWKLREFYLVYSFIQLV